MKRLLSVVIPTYGRHDSLTRLLDGLRLQTCASLEILVIDQNAPGFLDSHLSAEKWEGVTWVSQEIPNASAARNLGFMRSQGDYVLFVDDDLEPSPDFCQSALDIFAAHPEVGCLCPVAYAATPEQALAELRPHHTGKIIPAAALFEIRQTISAAVFFERACFERSGGFDELLFGYVRTAEDHELFLRMGLRGQSIWLASELSIFHNEKVSGGCELRTAPQWETRARCVKSWAFRARIHRGKTGRLTVSDLIDLARSSFLNSGIWRFGLKRTGREMALLWHALRDSKNYLKPHFSRYARIDAIDHLQKYKNRLNSPQEKPLLSEKQLS